MSGFNWGGPNTSNFKFDLGANPVQADIAYNTPSNWGYAWQRVMDQLGATNPSSNWYKFLQNWSSQAKSSFGPWQLDNPTGRVQDYLTGAVGGLGDQYSLLSPEDRGANPRIAGTPRFLG